MLQASNQDTSTMNVALVAISFLLTTRLLQAAGQAVCSNAEIRLTDGPSNLAGRLEICFNNQWGTVCAGNTWTESNAQVVCRQLDHSTTGAIALNNAYFGSGEGIIHLSDIQCGGDEENIVECVTSLIGGEHNCTHDQDVAVVCQNEGFTCTNGEVRLVGGSNEQEGRVEVCYNNQYGTVCDDEWDSNDASVICRQLGYQAEGALVLKKAIYGEGYGHIYYDDLQCTGTESNITECTHTKGGDNCYHSEDASVICKPNTPICQNGEIRLANGRIASEGRVETCYNGVWGTVCHDFWTDKDAGVVCSQLGYSREGAKAIQYADFGEGEGLIFLDNVQCDGSELHLNECISNDIGEHNCDHQKDAGVICKDPSFSCTDGEIRLVDGLSSNVGRVEICYDNHYGTICHNGWNQQDASVVCAQLGFEREGAIALKGDYYGAGVGIIQLGDLSCDGDEENILSCSHSGIAGSNCYHDQDAAVLCKEKNPSSDSCDTGEIRLVGGTVFNEGVVEICVNGVWGGVCDDGWDDNDATVVCRQLGCEGTTSISIPGGHYLPQDIPLFLSNVTCTRSELTLSSCIEQSDIGTMSCTAHKQAGVICHAKDPPCQNGEVRLLGGVSSEQGRVEVCYNGVWGTMCGEDRWTHTEAAVICHQLGYNLTETRPIPVPGGSFGIGRGPVLLSGVHCFGNEDSIFDCTNTDIKYQICSHSLDVGVICSAYPCQNGDIRLKGGDNEREGRLEVCHNEKWQGLCANDFSTTHAGDICSSLGFSNEGSYSLSGLFSQDISSLSSVLSISMSQCVSGSDIVSCLTELSSDKCDIKNTIGLICESINDNDSCITGSVRLMDGANEMEGRVEVCIGDVWGTVCDDLWDDKAASVVCQQLGYQTEDIVSFIDAYFGEGNGAIHLDNIHCMGYEPDLLHCVTNGIRNHNCQHNEDVGVKCEDLSPTDKTPHTTVSTTHSTTVVMTTATNSESNLGEDTDPVENAQDKKTGISNDLIIPIAVMVTIAIVAICITICTIVIFKWRRLKLIIKGDHELKTELSVNSALPDIV